MMMIERYCSKNKEFFMSISKEDFLELLSSFFKEKNEIKETLTSSDYVIVRTYSMGVFAGYLNEKSTETCKILNNARRIWYWDGASSLSELAEKGTSKPENCKFPLEVQEVQLTSPNGFEILKVSEIAKKSIASVKIWTQH
jgi:hypothetical protein